jgi:hypothetical protein
MTVIPDKHTFTIWQGTSFYETLVLYNDAAGTQVKNLTGYTAEMIVREKPNGEQYIGPDADFEMTYVIDGANGKITLKLSPEQTAGITWKGAVYDLTITSPSPNPVTDAILYGAVKVQGV